MYISLLSGVGERVAFQMKSQLFSSLLSQDLSFFDEERTGELMNRFGFSIISLTENVWNFKLSVNIFLFSRLTTDVQNFKSAFKHCVSQGLRSGTQVLKRKRRCLYYCCIYLLHI